MADVVEGGTEAPVVLSEQQQIEADAVLRFKQSQPGYVDPNPEVVEGFNADGTPIEADANIPDKYKGKSIEEVITMHQEAEKKIGQPAPETTPATPETPPKEGDPAPEPKAEDATGFAKYTDEYATTGIVSEDSYKELEAKGFPRSDVDAYIAGQKAIGASFTAKIYDLTGGQENYTELIKWAETGMDTETVSEYNIAIANGDQAKVARLVEFMALKHGSLNRVPNRIQGTSTGEGGGLKPFAHKAEWQQAINPRTTPYGKDAKYTKMIDTRYLASKRKGTL